MPINICMNFNAFINKILKECESVAGVYGNDGPYDTSDGRTPNVLGPMLRRNPKKSRHKKKRK